MLSLSSLHKACCVDSMESCRRRRIPDDPQIVSAWWCGGNSACVGRSGQTLRKKGFCRTSCFAVCVCLKIPSPGSREPAGQTPSDLGGVRVIRTPQSAPVDHQGKSEGSSFHLAACRGCFHFSRRAVWTAWKGVAEDEFLMTRRLCLHGGVGAILLAWVGQARHFGRKAFAERLVLLFACALRSPHQVRENPAGQTPSIWEVFESYTRNSPLRKTITERVKAAVSI